MVLSLGLLKSFGDHVMFHCQPLHNLLAAKHVVKRLEASKDNEVSKIVIPVKVAIYFKAK